MTLDINYKITNPLERDKLLEEAINETATNNSPTRIKYSPTVAEGLVNTYKTRVIAAGDTLTDLELTSLRKALSLLIKSTAYEKLRELWVPMGTSATTGAMVKIINDPSATTSMTPVNLVSGDYTRDTGITGNGTTKYINTGFNPTTAAVQTDGWGFGVFSLNTTASGALAGTITGFNTYLMYSSLSDSRFNNIQMSGTQQYPRFCAIQGNVTEAAVYHGGSKALSVAYASATLPNVNIGLLTANGGNFSAQSVCGWAAWGVPLTSSELKDLAVFFDSINYSLGRLVFKTSISACGDSNSRGYVPAGGTAVATRWSAQLSTKFGLTDNNTGVDDSTISDNAAGGAGGWVATRKAVGTVAKAPTLITVALGTNDARYGVSPEDFKADYITFLNYQFSAGFLPEQFILCTPIAATDAPTNQDYLLSYVQIVKDLASTYGCKVFDAYAATKGVSGIWQYDNLHLNQAGHDLYYSKLKEVVQADL